MSLQEFIKDNLDSPEKLEKLYQKDKQLFTGAFSDIYPEIQSHIAARVWYERLHYSKEEVSWGSRTELYGVLLLCAVSFFLAKLPAIAGLDDSFYFSRNIGYVVFPSLMAYFIWKKHLGLQKIMIVAGFLLVSCLYINLLPDNPKSDTLILSCVHLPLFLWCLLGYVYMSGKYGDRAGRMSYLKYNGELAVMSSVILLCGMILTVLGIGLFEVINIRAEKFYFDYIVVAGLSSAPLIASFLVQSNPKLVHKVSPVLAKIFTPLVLCTLLAYLTAIFVTGKDPYNDRDFLMLFNFLLLGVMALIFFSVSGSVPGKVQPILLFALSVTAIVVNGITLSAIIFRIAEWGTTPNRLAVAGGNLLIFGNLLVVSYALFRAATGKAGIERVEACIANWLPLYAVWTIIVCFLFPFIFGFR